MDTFQDAETVVLSAIRMPHQYLASQYMTVTSDKHRKVECCSGVDVRMGSATTVVLGNGRLRRFVASQHQVVGHEI